MPMTLWLVRKYGTWTTSGKSCNSIRHVFYTFEMQSAVAEPNVNSIELDDRSSNFQSCLSEDVSAVGEALVAYAGLKHMWRRPDILLRLRSPVQYLSVVQFCCMLARRRVCALNMFVA